MGGLQASDLIILAGRPGMGKTSLATNIAMSTAAVRASENFWKPPSYLPVSASS
jgi:replicative DNA helicase